MRVFEKVVFIDGGPNDNGVVMEYKLCLFHDPIPVNTNNFEQWREITFQEYNRRKKQAKLNYNLFL
jgi:hypothetical protein